MAAAARDLRRDRVRVGRAPLRASFESARYVFRLARRLRQLRPDLVHTNSLKAAVYGCLAGRVAGVPVVVHVRDRIADDYLPLTAVRLVRLLLRRAPVALIANSQTTLETLQLSSSRAASTPSFVIPSFVVHDSVRAPSASVIRDADRFVVAMVGRISRWKGQDVFLRAFASAFAFSDEHALIVGSALFGEKDYEAELLDLVAQLGLGGRVEFTGFVEDVDAVLTGADVLVHASVIPEPFGQVVLEGMAAGLPVIAAASGGPAEIITTEEDGLLVPPGDVRSLAAALVRLRTDPSLRDRLRAGGRRRALKFGPEDIAEQVSDVYDACTSRTSAL
jgi:glycosyltransferase involved in cell wall biosynthesis